MNKRSLRVNKRSLPAPYRPAFKPQTLIPFHREQLLSKKEFCKQKVARADRARRVQFFRAKGRGATSPRPVHLERHDRRC